MKIVKLFAIIFSVSIAASLNAMEDPNDSDKKYNVSDGGSDSEETINEDTHQNDGENNLIDIQLSPTVEVQPNNSEPTNVRVRRIRGQMATVLAQEAQNTQPEVDLNDLNTYFTNLTLDPKCLACCWLKDNCTCMQVVDFSASIHDFCNVCGKWPCNCKKDK